MTWQAISGRPYLLLQRVGAARDHAALGLQRRLLRLAHPAAQPPAFIEPFFLQRGELLFVARLDVAAQVKIGSII